ncbi:MAG: type II secretion system protein [Muribaculaceae bacterium]|nr:type II secretion system protein [Muribaculaceae bacterium]
MKQIKLGFTLAEVLITLGIIGVVAAITLPGLISAHKAHRLRSQFLKSYSIVQQVFKQMEADDVSLDPKTYPSATFYKTFMKYLRTPLDCSRLNAKKVLPCYNYSDTVNQYKSFDGKNTAPYTWFDDGQIALQDGTLILFENYTVVNPICVSVDINGFNNPPNRWGYDLFTFEFINEELRPMGDRETRYNNPDEYCNQQKPNILNGITCAHKAKSETDYFKKLVKEFK